MKIRRGSRSQTVRLMVTGNPESPYTLMIEPWGMTYELGDGDRVLVDLEVPEGDQPELVSWPGGFSIYACGRAVTRDRNGDVLHEF